MTTRPARGRQKPRKDGSQSPPPLKVIVRRLPPNLPENTFHTSIAAWHKAIEWSDYVAGKLSTSRVESDTFSRAYLKFRKHLDVLDFLKRYHGHAFVSAEGREYRACAEIAPFQKVPKVLSNSAKIKDNLCGTLDQDPEFLAFQESLKTIVPHKKELEIAPSKITPLIEHLRAQKLKNEAKAKARRAKEALAKGKVQEDKKKTQAQASSVSVKARDKGTASSKSQRAKNGPSSDAATKSVEMKQSSKKGSKGEAAKNQDTEKKGSLTNGKNVPKAESQTMKSVNTKPSSLAQQRLAAKPKPPSINPRAPAEDVKSSKPKKNKKKEQSKASTSKDSKTMQEKRAPVDISGPTPAEMAALNKAKT